MYLSYLVAIMVMPFVDVGDDIVAIFGCYNGYDI